MYYAHFGLKEPPFKITPNTEVFFTGGNRGAVLDAIAYAILNGEGIVKVVGEVGSGKTMLCRMLQTQLPDRIESIYLANPSVAPEEVLHAIAFELQIKVPKNADRIKVMQMLQDYLLKRHAAGKQVVIFIEEAQGMPLASLEEIRLLSNLETNYDKLLQIVMFGQPELDENLNQVSIRQLRERITHSFHLAPLQMAEIGEYIMFRLRAAGYYGPPLFTNSAIKKLANAAKGLVRRVNVLSDKALLAAFADGVYQVTPKHIEAAIADSEFGLEQARLSRGGNKLWLLVLMLIVGLLIGVLVSYLLQHQSLSAAESVNPPTVDHQLAADQEQANQNVLVAKVPEELATHQPAELPVNQLAEQPPAAGIAEDGILSQRLKATDGWLSEYPKDTITIQIMGGHESDQLKSDLELLSRKLDMSQLYVYRTQVNARPFLNVLYGSFADKYAAVDAIKGLPSSIRKNQPQLRTIGGVLQETKQLP